MFLKTRRLIIDKQLKRKCCENKKLLMIDRKRRKTDHSSSLGDRVGDSKKLKLQKVDGGDEGSKKGVVISNRKSERKLASILREVIRSRKKRKMEKVDKVDEVVEPVDRISDLPEPIIHHILTFLRFPSDITRITALSKKWKSIWTSFFFFDFDQKNFQASGGIYTEKFITYVDNSLATKLEPMHGVQKFKLSLCYVRERLIFRMTDWISAALNKNVKELEIHVDEKKKRHYMLPKNIFTSKTLTSLKLYGCKFDGVFVIDLSNLKELAIKESQVNADVIDRFIQGCPLIEDLRLIHCNGIGRLRISTLVKLNRLELHECHGLISVNVDLPSLITFLYSGKESWLCEKNLAGCTNLKCLRLKDPNLTDESFQDFLTKFPCIEKLFLRECNNLKLLTIMSETLKELSVIRCKKIGDVIIDTPKLSSLEYSGDKMPFSLMDITRLHEAKLHLQVRKNKVAVLQELLMFLRRFENNGAWKLAVNCNKNITIYDELREIKHLSSNDIKLELIKSPMKLKGYIDHLLRMSRPKALSLVSSSSSEILKFAKEKIMSREKNPKCCIYYSRKCWLHYIKDVKMMVFKDAETETGETYQNLQQTTFTFNWNSLNLQNMNKKMEEMTLDEKEL